MTKKNAMTGEEYMYQAVSKSLHQNLKKRIKGMIYTYIDMEKDLVIVEITGLEVKTHYEIPEAAKLLSEKNTNEIAKVICDSYKKHIIESYFV